MTDAPAIQIDRIDRETLLVPIVGTAPLIVSNFSEKSKRQMLDAQQGHKAPKVNRDPQVEYEAAFYRIAREGEPDAYGVPAVCFKAATIGAARFYRSVKMTEIRQFMYFRGILTKADPQAMVEIFGSPPEMREDVVRLAGVNRSADLRFRPMFEEWTTTLEVQYVKSSISKESVLSLIDAGGSGCGVCEWRPERNGSFGTYEIDSDRETVVVGS